jgi:T-complex protein 1 subunit beta
MNSGSSEMLMSDAVSKLAAKTPGKEAVAMEAYAKALRMVLNIVTPVNCCNTQV